MPARKKTRRPVRRSRARKRSRAPRRPEHPDALRLLAADHARVKELFGRFERTRGAASREALAERICQELTLHTELEEAIVYPRVREAIRDDALMNEAAIEHASANDLIGQIEAASPSDPKHAALVAVLREYVLHHVKEEEGEMFPRVRRSGLDRRALAQEMQHWKADHRGGRGGLASLLGL